MIMNSSQAGRRRFSAMVLAASLLCGCSMLLPVRTPPPTLFSFDSPQSAPRAGSTGAYGRADPDRQYPARRNRVWQLADRLYPPAAYLRIFPAIANGSTPRRA